MRKWILLCLSVAPSMANAAGVGGIHLATRGGGLSPGATVQIASATVTGNFYVYAPSTFTAEVTFSSKTVIANAHVTRSTTSEIALGPGLVTSPSLYWDFASSNGRRAGLYSGSAGSINATAGATDVFSWSSTQLSMASGRILAVPAGSKSAPSVQFAGFTGGFFGVIVDYVGLGIGGFESWRSVQSDGSTSFNGKRPFASVSISTSAHGFGTYPILSVSSETKKFEVNGCSVTVTTPFIVGASTQNLFQTGISSWSFLVTTGTFDTQNYHVAVSTLGHFTVAGGSPVISGCGAAPSGSPINATDTAGTVQVGGGATTACTVTFGTPYKDIPGNPVCIGTDNNAAVAVAVGSISKTAVTFNFGVSLGGGILYYHCMGVRE